jgi:hypothetical protein
MPAPDHTATPATDPALLRIDGPIATITLNRPAAFNAIDLSIAKKLEQLSAEVEASDDIQVLVIEGQGRAFCAGGDLQTMSAAAAADTVAPVIGELLHHYHAFIATLRQMPKIVLASVYGSAAGAGLSLAFVADLALPPRTPASRRPMPSSAYRLTAAAPSAWSRASARAARCRYFSPKTAFRQSKPMTGVWSPRSCRRQN